MSVFFIAWPAYSDDISHPVVSIIMDDLGDTLQTGKQAISLPYSITYSFLPQSHHTRFLANLASYYGKEIMLHLPMEPLGSEPMGKGGLLTSMTKQRFLTVLRENMMSVPNFVGINNHMGSRLTGDSRSMRWLMDELGVYEDLYFVDSFTTLHSVAYKTAVKNSVPAVTRDVFLDHDKRFAKMDYYFKRMIRIARRQGYAVAIAHPHPQTIHFLAKNLPKLDSLGIHIVPVSQLLEIKKRREVLWRASLSPSPKAVKN